jgi:SAM-dependent methyltransferase
VVEVASNDGTVLSRFQEVGCQILGVDPARNIAEAASADGIPTLAEFFTDELARDLARTRGGADVVIARNVLPHVKSIHSVVRGMADVLANDGIAVAEFHDAGIIESELHYDSVYHEHLFYFTLTSMARLFAQVGLHPFDVMRSPISGGSWVLFLSKDPGRDRGAAAAALEAERTSGIDRLDTWQAFGDRSRAHATRLQEMVAGVGRDLIGYGASARSSTLLNFCGLRSPQIRAVIDRNPLKHGMLTPGTAIPIVSFEEGLGMLGPEEVVLLLSWNLKDEIIRDLRSEGFAGRIIVPLPCEPEVL